MTNIFDNDILETQTSDSLFIDLECGYGQPSVSTVYLKNKSGTVKTLLEFNNNAIHLKIGNIPDIKYNVLEIHTTIDDIRDSLDEQMDISMKIVISENNSNFVSTDFTRKTKGKGSRINSFYTVTVL